MTLALAADESWSFDVDPLGHCRAASVDGPNDYRARRRRRRSDAHHRDRAQGRSRSRTASSRTACNSPFRFSSPSRCTASRLKQPLFVPQLFAGYFADDSLPTDQ